MGSLDVVYKLLKTCEVSQEFLDSYVKKWFQHCKNEVEGSNQKKKVRLICRLVIELLDSGKFDPSPSVEIWIDFCSAFKNNKLATEMYKKIMEKLKSQEEAKATN